MELQYRNSRLLPVFIAKIRQEYELTGEVTIWRSKVDSRGRLVLGQQIREPKLVLTENETLFVMYDKTVEVIPGGVGTGAKGFKGLAQGGFGTGGSVTIGRNQCQVSVGGDGLGGSLIGEKATGKGGDGWGGQVENGEAGDGVGGDIRKRDPILTAS